MTIFGYVGPFPGGISPPDLESYGACIAPIGPGLPSRGGANSWCGCWGPSVACEDDITTVVAGRPLVLPRPDGDTGPRSAAALVLATYKASGLDLVECLHGQFSFAIIDRAARRVALAIDRMGIERLAYATIDSGIVFSSSALAVAKCPPFRPRLRRQAVYDYLVHHMVPGPGTIFTGVFKLPPASLAVFEDARIDVRRYWKPVFASATNTSFRDLKEQLVDSLKEAVIDQAPDSTTGAFLSGGLDSSTVSGVLSRVHADPTRTFSIGFGYADYDELDYARIANRHFGCLGHEYVVNGADIADALPLIARVYDEPFGNSSALPTYYCARLARQHGINHLLAGDGGDELFAGNSRYAEQRTFELYGLVPGALRQLVLEPALRRCPDWLAPWFVRKARGYVEKADIQLPGRLEAWNVVLGSGVSEVLHQDLLASVDPCGPLRRMEEVWKSTPSTEYLHRMLYYDWHYTLADNDLRKVQTMAAAAGVRVSYPMLHRKVVDLSTRIPPSIMMPDGRLRRFYKEAMKDFLPREIVRKKKHGFGLPFGLWLKESPDLQRLVFENLHALRSRNVVNPGFIDRLIHHHENVHAGYFGVFVWVLAMLELWLQAHDLQV